MSEKLSVYERITARIVAKLEQGVRPWAPMWDGEGGAPLVRPLRACGTPYRGINVAVLWARADEAGFRNPRWMTFNQARELGGCVRKGEKGELVVYANKVIRAEENPRTGEEELRAIPFLKGYHVFNVEQIEGLPARFYQAGAPLAARPSPLARIEAVDSFVASTRADVRHGGTRAFYTPAADYIQMPPFEAFHEAEGYASVLLHELIHWTKGPGRIERDFGRKRWGDEGYATEELVAELGAAFLCADLGVSAEPREDHASYIASWIKVLKDDPRAIFSASSHAQRAADFLHAMQPGAAKPAEAETPAEAAHALPLFAAAA